MSESRKSQSPIASGTKVYSGGCHCGAVRFEAELDLGNGATRCNCSICTKVGATAIIVKPSAFRLLAGAENLGEYRVTAGSPNHRSFCQRCGNHVFGQGNVPEIGGAFVSVNVNALENVEHSAVKIQFWDGRHDNWAAGLRPEPWPVLS
ncbi:GFA family protein [Myxococcaceae bacterium GXIMD 01537]